jgi:hypothetical protein
VASDVDICNLALSNLGDPAIVQSINPPDGSAQSSHCSRFYPIARDSLLDQHAWSFCTTRSPLALAASNPTINALNPNGVWAYAYAVPAGALQCLAVLSPQALDDYSAGVPGYSGGQGIGAGSYQPQPFATEADASGNPIILTNVQNAILRYTVGITDTTKFTPQFIEALGYKLASMLAGALLKGQSSVQMAKAMLQLHKLAMAQAVSSDTSSRNIKPVQGATWITGRL